MAALSLDLAFSYSINRIMLFALILALGLIVDDPIASIDNIKRYLKRNDLMCFKQAKERVSEAETTYGFSIITAPFDGVIDTCAINVGDTATPGMHLLSLYNPDTL